MTGQEIYELILNSNIINFTIMVSILVLIFKKCKLGKIFDDIADDIKNNVTSSAQAVKNALARYKEAKREQKNIGGKKQLILDGAQDIIEKMSTKNENDIKNKEIELENIKNKTKEILTERAKEKTANEIKEAVYKLSSDVIKSNMTDDIQFQLIKNALDELDKIEEVKI